MISVRALYHHPRCPRWLQRVLVWRARRNLLRHFARVDDSLANDAGWQQRYVAAGGDATLLLPWLDEQFAFHLPLGPLDWTVISVLHAPDSQQLPLDSSGDLADPKALLAQWDGTPRDWWLSGRDSIASALTAPHAGVLITVDSVHRAWRTLWPS